jgi:hypothetical protein
MEAKYNIEYKKAELWKSIYNSPVFKASDILTLRVHTTDHQLKK